MSEKCPGCGRPLTYKPIPGAIIEVLPCVCGQAGYMITGKKRSYEK